jgi:quercetin dioxygenase-like cupin family protein
MDEKPYKEIKYSNTIYRKFYCKEDAENLTWHRDELSRYILVVISGGWKLQLDNKLPFSLKDGSTYHIPKGTWHRVIAGNQELLIKIKEIA